MLWPCRGLTCFWCENFPFLGWTLLSFVFAHTHYNHNLLLNSENCEHWKYFRNVIVSRGRGQPDVRLNCKQQHELILGFVVCSHVLISNIIGHNTFQKYFRCPWFVSLTVKQLHVCIEHLLETRLYRAEKHGLLAV